MTLCGVLKDILLVAASMAIWHTPVTGLQFFGYSIALGGLVYYKLGGDKIKEYGSQAQRSWAEYGSTNPGQRRLVIIGAVVVGFFLFVGALAPSYAPDSVDHIRGALGGGSVSRV